MGTANWRAVCGKTACTVRREGRLIAFPTPIKLDEVEKYLSSYANFAMARGDTHIASKTAIEWASQASSENERSRRSDVLIRFARFARAEDGRNEIPPDGVFYGRWHRRTPYIYTDEEVQKNEKKRN